MEALQAKYSALDKTKARIAAELEDLNLDMEKVYIQYKPSNNIENIHLYYVCKNLTNKRNHEHVMSQMVALYRIRFNVCIYLGT